MAAQVYVDPDELERFLNRLVRFSREIGEATQRLRGAIGRLQSTWRDQEFEKFAEAYRRTEQELQILIREVETVQPHLRNDIDFIRAYIQQQLGR